MTLQEYYERYWTINGQKPPELSESDKQLFSLWDSVNKGKIKIDDVLRLRKRQGGYNLMLKLKSNYDKLPDFLKQTTKQLKK